MNDCQKYQELISRLVDGEVNKNEYAALEAHMENCAECSAMYAVFASLSDIIGSEDEPLPEDLHENIMAGVRRQAMINKNKRRLSKPMRSTLAAAACAALVLFAARGLSPAEKAQGTVVSRSEAAVMDAQLEAAPAQAEPAAAPVQESSVAEPEMAAAVAPTATVQPTATPVPTKDVYLSSGDEAKSDAGSAENKNSKTEKNNSQNFIVVTEPPRDIPVETLAPSPVPTVAPTPAATPVPTAVPTPVPTEAPAEPSAKPEAAAVSEEAAPKAEASPAAASAQPEAASASPAAAVSSEAPAQTEAPAATESPSLVKRFMAFMAPKPAADTAAETEEAVSSEQPQPEASAVPSPVPAEEKAKPYVIELAGYEKQEELEALLEGEDAELPEEDWDKAYIFIQKEPDEFLKDCRLEVYVYGENIYFVQVLAEDDKLEYSSTCKIEDFEKFLESLSDEEKAPLLVSPSPSVSPTGSPAPTASVSPLPSPQPSAESK